MFLSSKRAEGGQRIVNMYFGHLCVENITGSLKNIANTAFSVELAAALSLVGNRNRSDDPSLCAPIRLRLLSWGLTCLTTSTCNSNWSICSNHPSFHWSIGLFVHLSLGTFHFHLSVFLSINLSVHLYMYIMSVHSSIYRAIQDCQKGSSQCCHHIKLHIVCLCVCLSVYPSVSELKGWESGG